MPASFLFILATPLIVSWAIFITLFVLFQRKGLRLNKKQSYHFKALIIGLVLAIGLFAAFEDQDFVFDCRSETQRCEYYHSTLMNKELRLAGSYDISGATNAEIKKHFHRRRKTGYNVSFYKIAFVSPDGEFEMPYEFSFYEDAQDEVAKIGSFLTKEEKSYRYERLRSKNGNIFLFIMLGTFAEIIAVSGSILFGVNLYQAKKKRK